ncbi:MAG: hypothetical protein FJ145_05760 [Deltaproteobacteria bacterium]|nr:hypothetical protein [Deltaproteobacteria bacterium]
MKPYQALRRSLHNVASLNIATVAAVALIALTDAVSAGEHWTDPHLKAGRYNLSLAEEQGVYSCSVRDGKVVDVEFSRGYVTVIFDAAAPRFSDKRNCHGTWLPN